MIVATGHSEDLDSADAIEEALDHFVPRMAPRTLVLPTRPWQSAYRNAIADRDLHEIFRQF